MQSRSRSTPATTSGPASDPRPASSAPATKRAPSRRSNWRSLGPVRFAIRARIAPAAAVLRAGSVKPSRALALLGRDGFLADRLVRLDPGRRGRGLLGHGLRDRGRGLRLHLGLLGRYGDLLRRLQRAVGAALL